MINFCEVIEISNNLSFLLNFGTSRLLLPLSSLAETALDCHLNRQSILFSNFSLDFLLTLLILKSRPISITIPNSKKINISLSHCIVNKVTFFRYFPLSFRFSSSERIFETKHIKETTVDSWMPLSRREETLEFLPPFER